MKLINLTPHTVNIVGGESLTSEGLARVASSEVEVGRVNDLPLVTVVFGEVQGLPEPQENTMFIVSRLVKSAVPNRTDCVVPNALERDSEGRVVGCKNFAL